MTRFDAAAPAERRKLFFEAIRAHRERGSPFLTIEAEPPGEGAAGDPAEGSDPLADAGLSGGGGAPFDGEGDDGEAIDSAAGGGGGATDEDPAGEGEATDDGAGGEEGPTPWVQFADGVVNLDCTDRELDRLKALLEEFPAFRIDELTRPDDAAGTNVRVTARADPNRTAEFIDEVFRSVYERPRNYRAWVVEV